MSRHTSLVCITFVLIIPLACATAPDPTPAETSAESAEPQDGIADSPYGEPGPSDPSPTAPLSIGEAEELLGEQRGGFGDLLIAPTRLVFEGRDRSAQLTLVNIGPETATYRIEFTELKMTEEGKLVTIEAPEEPFMPTSPLVRYAPRQVELAPGVAQTVRIQLRKPADLAAGEYRSHLLFQGVPEPVPEEDDTELEPGEFQIRLRPVYGISIPVIVRHGETFVSGRIIEAELEPRTSSEVPYSLKVTLGRDGNRSFYGSISVRHQSSSGETAVVAEQNGVAVYTPLTTREISIPLRLEKDGELSSGELVVELREGRDPGAAVISSRTIILPRPRG